MAEEKCPIWGTYAKVTRCSQDMWHQTVNSPRAGGWYGVHDNVTDGPLTRADEQIKARITTWLVAQRRAGVACPELTSGVMEEMERRAPMQAHERADRLLALLSEKSKTIGSFVILNGPDNASRVYPNLKPSEATAAIWQVMITTESTKWEEVGFLSNYLKSKKWIEELPPSPSAESGQWPRFVITVDGYSRLAELEKASVNSSQAFVAMWFNTSMNDAYEKGVEPGIEDAGYKPVRIDRKDHNNKIDDEIIAEIRRSRFLVADFTADYDLTRIDSSDADKKGARGGVYYEAGFAHGLSIPVIFTCREDVISKVHFDTRQYNHLIWKTPNDLRQSLANRISATIGDGPLKRGQ